jgi:hypothetical protein
MPPTPTAKEDAAELAAIRERANDIVAIPAAVGRFYDPASQAIHDRQTLLGILERLEGRLMHVAALFECDDCGRADGSHDLSVEH